jgi:hypothetical protein
MTLVGSGIIVSKLYGKGVLATLSPEAPIITQYNLIDGGAPNTNYQPINGFNLISGGFA